VADVLAYICKRRKYNITIKTLKDMHSGNKIIREYKFTPKKDINLREMIID